MPYLSSPDHNRTDKRVWIDFEARIPAPLDARPRLIEIRRPAKKLAP